MSDALETACDPSGMSVFFCRRARAASRSGTIRSASVQCFAESDGGFFGAAFWDGPVEGVGVALAWAPAVVCRVLLVVVGGVLSGLAGCVVCVAIETLVN